MGHKTRAAQLLIPEKAIFINQLAECMAGKLPILPHGTEGPHAL